MLEENWFSYPIWYSNEQYPLNEELMKYCYAIPSRDNGRIISNINGWQSNNLPLDGDLILQNFSKFLKKQIATIEKRFQIELDFSNMWININGKNAANGKHVHHGCVFSGIYYVKASEDQGKVIFENMNMYWHQMAFCDFWSKYNMCYSDRVSYKPETGKLIIFPSCLPHFVESNKTDSDRISIAFNMFVKS